MHRIYDIRKAVCFSLLVDVLHRIKVADMQMQVICMLNEYLSTLVSKCKKQD
jgi:hypothetical protein